MGRFRLPVACVVLLLAVACGGSGSLVPSAANVAGDWAGTWQFVTSGVTVADSVNATFTQTGRSAAGVWTAGSGASGQFQLTLASSVSGSMTISQTLVGGVVCSASAQLTGTVTQTTMTLSVAAIPNTPGCQWATDQRFELQR